jgi:hypothetical protein
MLVIGVVWACYAPTELVAAISTDVECGAVRTNGVSIKTAQRSGDLTNTQVATESIVCNERGGSNDLGTLVLIPSGDADDVVIEVVLGVDRRTSECQPPTRVDGCIVARRHVGFVRHRSLRVPITLTRSCVGVQCREDETCDRSGCVSAAVVSCPGGECLLETEMDGGVSVAPSDAGPRDASSLVDAPNPVIDSGITDAGICPPRPPPPPDCAACTPAQDCCIAQTSLGGVMCVNKGTCPERGQDPSAVCTHACHCPAYGGNCTTGVCPVKVCGGDCAFRR